MMCTGSPEQHKDTTAVHSIMCPAYKTKSPSTRHLEPSPTWSSIVLNYKETVENQHNDISVLHSLVSCDRQ